MRVAINAQLTPGRNAGGVERFVMGLVYSLGQLDDGPEEYVVISHWQDRNWLEPYLGANQRIVLGPRPSHAESMKHSMGRLRRPMGRLWRTVRRLVHASSTSHRFTVPDSHGFYESQGVDVVHFPYQSFVRCNLPIIFTPHDLQHLHYPQFFTQEETAWRESIYPTGCREAHAVAVESLWIKHDITRQYGIDPEKIYVIPFGAPTELWEPTAETNRIDLRRKFQLPDVFALYPAETWAHKNHIRLLEAIALLRDQDGLIVNLVCTGKQNDYWATIQKRLRELNLGGQVRFPGFIDPIELRTLYRMAQFLVFPSLFEGGGFPVLEAFREEMPVTCSTVTSLPEYGGDAVLLFDPNSVESIAAAMAKMARDAELRALLIQRGKERIRLFTWARTAKTYRALYRKLGRRPLSDEERYLLTGGLGGGKYVIDGGTAPEGQWSHPPVWGSRND